MKNEMNWRDGSMDEGDRLRLSTLIELEQHTLTLSLHTLVQLLYIYQCMNIQAQTLI